MICESCGASYRLKETHCPFCGSENPVMAEIRKEEVLKGIDLEAGQMRERVRKDALRKWTKIIGVIFGIFMGAGVFFGIGVMILAPILSERNFAKTRKNYEKLEKFCENEDWEGLEQYIWDKDCYGSEYEKYDQLREAYWNYQNVAQALDWMKQAVQYWKDAENPSGWEENLSRSAVSLNYYLYRALYEAEKPINDRVILGNEEYLEGFLSEVIRFSEECGITTEDGEVYLRMKNWDEEDPRVMELTEKIKDHFMTREGGVK